MKSKCKTCGSILSTSAFVCTRCGDNDPFSKGRIKRYSTSMDIWSLLPPIVGLICGLGVFAIGSAALGASWMTVLFGTISAFLVVAITPSKPNMHDTKIFSDFTTSFDNYLAVNSERISLEINREDDHVPFKVYKKYCEEVIGQWDFNVGEPYPVVETVVAKYFKQKVK